MRSFNKYGTMVAVAALFAASGTVAQAADADLQSLQQQINQLQQQLQAVQAKQAATPAVGPLEGAASVPTAPGAMGPYVPATAQSGGWLQYGSDIGGFVIPGTKTALKIGGNVKLDTAWDVDAGLGIAGLDSYGIRGATNGTAQNGFALPGTAGARQQGRFSATASYSRLYADTRTPTEFGDVKMYFEGDFSGPTSGGNANNSNSHDFRIRHAYGTIGNFTAGQTWTNFTDPASWANSVDDNGPIGRESGVRQALVQYRWDIDPAQKNQLAFSAEEANSDISGADTESFYAGAGAYNSTNFNTKMPDFVVKYTHNETWAHLYEATLVRNLEVNTAGVNLGGSNVYTGPAHDSTWGWGEQVGGKIFTGLGHEKNAITFHGVIGQGITRYMQIQTPYSAMIDSRGHLQALLTGGYHVAYQHFFDPKGQFQSNLIWGEQKNWVKNSLLANNTTAEQGLQVDTQEVELNFLWTPNQYVQMGPAYIRANTRVEQGYNLVGVAGATRSTSGTTAVDNRFQYSVNVGF
jgi:hypothetical protein